MRPVRDGKYIVFKKEEWDSFWSASPVRLDLPPAPIEDAVVIRTGDAFASPALHSYAAMVGVAISFMPPGEDRKNLLRIADYFNARAAEADERSWKVPS